MDDFPLELELAESGDLTPERRSEILRVCEVIFDEDLTELFEVAFPATHVLGYVEGALVTHAMWCTRWLKPGQATPLKTAYVEAVGTLPDFQRRGYASRVMRRAVTEIAPSYELAALCPATAGLYERLGWRFWEGPLAIRMPDGGLLSTPDEAVMIYELPGRPLLDVTEPLSAEWRPGEELW